MAGLGTREPSAEGAKRGAGRPGLRPGHARGGRAAGLDPPRPPARPAGGRGGGTFHCEGEGRGGGGGRGRPCASPPAAPPPASSGSGGPAPSPLARAGQPSLGQYLRSHCPVAPASAAEVPPPPSLNSAALSTASGLPVALLPEKSPSLATPLATGSPSEVVT